MVNKLAPTNNSTKHYSRRAKVTREREGTELFYFVKGQSWINTWTIEQRLSARTEFETFNLLSIPHES